jgi:hypothetical protein
MKNLTIIITVLILIGVGVFVSMQLGSNGQKIQPLTAVSPTPLTTDAPRVNAKAENIADEIKTQLVAKHGPSAQELEVTISKVVGDYAQGGASVIGEGGGMWFAAKINGGWQLVWDGNGIITCDDVSGFPDFPTSMIPQCYDTATGNMKTR